MKNILKIIFLIALFQVLQCCKTNKDIFKETISKSVKNKITSRLEANLKTINNSKKKDTTSKSVDETIVANNKADVDSKIVQKVDKTIVTETKTDVDLKIDQKVDSIINKRISRVLDEELLDNNNINKGVDASLTNTYMVDYDFQKGKFNSNNLKIKVNTPVVFKVSNINRLAYDVKVSAKDSILAETYFFDSPSDFLALGSQINKKLFNKITSAEVVETAKGKDLPAITSSDVSIKVSGTGKNKENQINKIIKDVSNIKKLELLVIEIDTLKNQINILKSQQNDSLKIKDKKKKNEIITKIKTAVAEKNAKEVEQRHLIAILDEALKIFTLNNEEFIKGFEKLKKSYNYAVRALKYSKKVSEAADNPELSHDVYKTRFKIKFNNMALELPNVLDSIDVFKERYVDLEILYTSLKYNPQLDEILNYGGKIKLFFFSETLKTMADKMNANMKEVNFEELVQKTLLAIAFLDTDEAYSAVFAPVQPFNDAVIFDVRINKKEKNSSELFNNRNFKHREFTYGGTRIDFSLGLAASQFWNTEVFELSVKDTLNASQISIQKKSDKLTVPSLIGLVTMSYRRTGYIAYGGSAGLGIDVTNGKIQLSNFFAGPSMIFGKYNRMTLTAGMSIRNVGQLKSGYHDKDIVTGTADDIDNFITDKYKIGAFVALTYNFTKAVKDNIKTFLSN